MWDAIFGAQSLIKDFIAGIFIVLENQYRVGDVVDLGGIGGKVVKITTRITVLRDSSGQVNYIPNGSVAAATNKTMEYAFVRVSSLGNPAVTIKITGKVLPGKQWAVKGELLKRLNSTFQKHKINLPAAPLNLSQAKK